MWHALRPWFRLNGYGTLFQDLGLLTARPLKIYYDNSAAIFFSKNDKYSKGAKQMELKYIVVKEEVQKQKSVNITY